VIHHLRRGIQNGTLVEGDRLPPEQSFVESLGVSRSTVRAALVEAEESGLIKSQKHRGRWIAGTAQSLQANSLIQRSVVVLSTWKTDIKSARHLGVEPAVDAGTCDMLVESGIHPIHMRLTRENASDLAEELARETPRGVIVDHADEIEDEVLRLLGRLKDAGVPVAVQSTDERFAPFDRVVADHESGAYDLAQELLRRGCRRILRVWHGHRVKSGWQRARDRGYERAMAEAAGECVPAVHLPDLLPRGHGRPDHEVFDIRVQQVAGFLIKPMKSEPVPDAIMATTDGQIGTLASALKMLDRRPNEDVLLAGYDNYWWLCWERQFDETRPILTMEKQNDEIGRSLVRLLLNRIENAAAEPQVQVVPPVLVEPGGVVVGSQAKSLDR